MQRCTIGLFVTLVLGLLEALRVAEVQPAAMVIR